MKRPTSDTVTGWRWCITAGILLLGALFSLRATAQTQLSFTGSPTTGGTFGAVNSTYTYSNVGTTGSTIIKAVIKITAIDGNASLYAIDANNGGSSRAWQPVINGSSGNGGCWGMTFTISFYDAATNAPLTLSNFAASGIDIDGNGGTLREYNEPYGLSSYAVESPSNLSISTVPGGYRFQSPKTQYSGILLSQTNVASTWTYTNTQSMMVKIGACCVGGSCSASGASERQYSLNFYDAVGYDNGMIILPVDFINVFGQQAGDKNYIFWQVAGESNLRRYSIEKSANGTNGFDVIGNVPAAVAGANVKQYQFVDGHPAETSFYRIKAVDNDGRSKYSSIIRVTGNSAETKLTMFNDRGGNISFALFSAGAGDLVIRIADQNGRLVHNSVVHAANGMNKYFIDGFSAKPRGVYFVHISGHNGTTYTSKFVN
jgi:hypothetical protein